MAEALVEHPVTARVVWLGAVADRGAGVDSSSAPSLTFDFAGPLGEAHAGRTRPSCSRVKHLHPRGTEIANTRQISIVSAEDLAATAAEMGVARLDPAWLGATLMVEGIADFTHLPPSSRLQGPDGLTLVVDMENQPCTLTGKAVDAHLPGQGPRFKPAAMGRRGVVAWVERPGSLRPGDPLRLFVPSQRGWQP